MRKAIGSYSVVLLMGNTVIAARDPLGIKPLCVGKTDSDVIVASESAAIDTLNGEAHRDVRPGDGGPQRRTSGSTSYRTSSAPPTASLSTSTCTDSIMDGRLVYDVRVRIGSILAEEHPWRRIR